MVEEAAGRRQQGAQGGEVLGGPGRAHVFEHADRGDGVELLAVQVPVVLVPDLHPVLEAGLPHALVGPVHLLVAEGDADHPGVMVAGGVDGHRPPPAPHVEQPGPGAPVEPELAADQLVLGRLGLLEGGGRRDEPGARVGPARAQHQLVEVVAHVVVVADRPGVPGRRVDPTGGTGLLGRWRQRAPRAPEPAGGPTVAASRVRASTRRRSRGDASRRAVSTSKMSPSIESSPATNARASPSSPGAHTIRRMASGEWTSTVPTASTVPPGWSALPSQNRNAHAGAPDPPVR